MNYNYSIYSYRTTYFVLSFNFGACVFWGVVCMHVDSIMSVCVRFVFPVPFLFLFPFPFCVCQSWTTKQICGSLIYIFVVEFIAHTLKKLEIYMFRFCVDFSLLLGFVN